MYLYLYMYRCWCTYGVTLRVFIWGTLQQFLVLCFYVTVPCGKIGLLSGKMSTQCVGCFLLGKWVSLLQCTLLDNLPIIYMYWVYMFTNHHMTEDVVMWWGTLFFTYLPLNMLSVVSQRFLEQNKITVVTRLERSTSRIQVSNQL